MLDNQEWMDREAAAVALGRIGPEARTAAPKLTSLLQDPTCDVIYAALAARRQVGVESDPPVPALIAIFKNGDRRLWLYAVHTLRKYGPKAKDAVPVLVGRLQDFAVRHKTDIVFPVFDTLCEIGPDAREALPASLHSWMIPSAYRPRTARRRKSRSFQRVRRRSIPLCSGCTTQRRSFPLRGAVVERAGAEDIPAIKALVRGKDEKDRRRALSKLEDLGPFSVPAMIDLLKDDDADVRGAVIRILGRMGRAAKEAAPAIAEILHDKDWHFRASAAVVLGQIGPDAKSSVPALSAGAQRYGWPRAGLCDRGPGRHRPRGPGRHGRPGGTLAR